MCGLFCNNRHLCPNQGIHQRRFSHIWAAHDGDKARTIFLFQPFSSSARRQNSFAPPDLFSCLIPFLFYFFPSVYTHVFARQPLKWIPCRFISRRISSRSAPHVLSSQLYAVLWHSNSNEQPELLPKDTFFPLLQQLLPSLVLHRVMGHRLSLIHI